MEGRGDRMIPSNREEWASEFNSRVCELLGIEQLIQCNRLTGDNSITQYTRYRDDHATQLEVWLYHKAMFFQLWVRTRSVWLEVLSDWTSNCPLATARQLVWEFQKKGM